MKEPYKALSTKLTNIQYIIIDGLSTDKTPEIIAQYAPHIHYTISEKDNGLYDAMNKGFRAATGDFVWFMNAGDHIFAPDTTEKIANLVTENTDILYGEVMLSRTTHPQTACNPLSTDPPPTS